MTLDEYLQNHTKRHKLQRGMYLYTCKICFSKCLDIEDHFRWLHEGMDTE